MNNFIILFVFGLVSVTGLPQSRILGGQLTEIQNYPYAVAGLITRNGMDYTKECEGVILNSRSVLTSTSCIYYTTPQAWRLRVGSSFANSGGDIYGVVQLISHPEYGIYRGNDIGIMRTLSSILFSDRIQAGRFAGANYNVADNVTVTSIGWGTTNGESSSSRSDQLRFANIRTINQQVCRRNYNIVSITVTPNMMCAGNPEQGGEGPCQGNYGSPLIHNDVVIGIASLVYNCGIPRYPSLFMRVSDYITWIQDNA